MKKALDVFGKAFIRNVFDRTVRKYGDMIFQRRTKGMTAQYVNEMLKGFSDEQRKHVYLIMCKAIEDASFNALDLFNQNEDFQLNVCIDGAWTNLSEASDGLSGELFGDSGWIARFSSTESEKH